MPNEDQLADYGMLLELQKSIGVTVSTTFLFQVVIWFHKTKFFFILNIFVLKFECLYFEIWMLLLFFFFFD